MNEFIKAENNIDNSIRFENANEELLYYQLQYIDKLEKGILKPLKDNAPYDEPFDEIESYIRSYLKEEYCKIMGEGSFFIREENIKFENWFDLIFNEFKDLHNKDDKDFYNEVFKLFRNYLNKLDKPVDSDKKILGEEGGLKCGLIHFFKTKIDKDLANSVLEEGEEYISIHLKGLDEQKKYNSNIKNIFSGDSLSLLALDIINNYPEIKGILAESWIVDSPIGKRIGFTEIKKYNKVVQNDSFWGQFINDKGEINKERIKKFLDTGIPEYFITLGFINIEDFLKKYLPKENKGIIELKEKTEDSKKFIKEISNINEELNNKWDLLSYEEIVFLINKNKELEKYFKTKDGKEFLNIIKKSKELNLRKNEIDTLDYKNKDIIKEKFEDFVKEKSNHFITKEVFIE